MHVHRSITRRTFLVAGSAAGLVAASGRLALAQAPAVKRGKADRVVFGIGLSAPFTPYVALVEKGIAAKHGIKAEYKIFESGLGGLEALNTGNAQVAFGAELTTLRPRASGAKILGVGRPLISPKDIGIGVSSKINGPQDFKGKKVGMIRATAGDYLFHRFTQKHGLREGTGPDQVQVLTVQPAEWIPAVQRGDIDGFFGWEPWLAKLPQIVKGARVYGYSSDDDLYTMWYTMAFREEWAREDPDSAGAAYAAVGEAMDWLNANKDEAVQLASRVFRVNAADMKIQMDGNQFLLDTKRAHPVRIKQVAAWAKEKGYLKVDDVDKLVDDFYYPDIAKKYAPARTDF
jgi:ABC-type nitrate/sulfonate/bicarbonate transport system substrate-binding protein